MNSGSSGTQCTAFWPGSGRSSMFDLNEAIRDWRQSMSMGGLKAAEVLDELESHLRDDVEAQVRSGSTPEDAFELATERIGQSAMLGCEFNKVEEISKLKDA